MQPTGWTLAHLFALLAISSLTVAVTVELGYNVTISCLLHCSTVEWWTKDVADLRILRFAGGNCDIIPEFAGRIECSAEKIRRGDVSLTINSVVYNDRGWYYCSCDGKFQCDRRIEVIVPASLNISVGGKCKIPCYAETDKRAPDSSVYVLWEKDGQQLVKLEQGQMVYSSGFEQRLVMSAEEFRKGDLSLIITDVRYSDSGLYRCSLKDEEYGYPNSVALSVQAHRFDHYEKEGDSVLLNLVMKPPVMVHFTSASEDTTEVWICTTTKKGVHCKAGYDHRASIVNASLMLSELTVADSGTYTITDITASEVFAFHRLVVIDLPSAKFPVSALASCGFFVVVLSALVLRAYHQKQKQQQQRQPKSKNKHEMRGPDEDLTVQLSIQQSENSYRPPVPWAMMKQNDSPIIEDPKEEGFSATQAADQGIQDGQS